MTSTPMYHPGDDEKRTLPEDQGDARAQEGSDDDLVDAETKELSQDEAAQHDDAIDAQKADAEEGGYGH